MKEDFCFTYYDGDATRDMAHMNRLERGAYTDIIISQRKFGHLTADRVKKCLGNDYAACIEAIEAVLDVDESGKFFIKWVDDSLIKMRIASEKQSNNGKKGGRPKKSNWAEKSQIKPNEKPNETLEKPLEDEDGFVNETDLKGVQGELFLVPQMAAIFKQSNNAYPAEVEKDYKPLLAISNFIALQLKATGPPDEIAAMVLDVWEKLASAIATDDFYRQKSLQTISNHIQEIYQKQHHGKQHTILTKTRSSKNAGAYELLADFKAGLNGTG